MKTCEICGQQEEMVDTLDDEKRLYVCEQCRQERCVPDPE